MMPKTPYSISIIDWHSPAAEACKAIRMAVFVDEQKVPAELEIDDVDPAATHVLATDESGIPCGTARLFSDPGDPTTAKIGRMAVMQSARGTGCGGAMLQALLQLANEQGYRQAKLSAQDHAVPFYEKFGFKTQGESYLDANIPHFTMVRPLPLSPP